MFIKDNIILNIYAPNIGGGMQFHKENIIGQSHWLIEHGYNEFLQSPILTNRQ